MMNRSPLLTYLSAILLMSGNLVAFGTLVWTAVTYPSGGLFEYIPLVIASYSLPFVDFVSLLILLLATWRKELAVDFRRKLYFVIIASYPIYLLTLVIYFQFL